MFKYPDISYVQWNVCYIFCSFHSSSYLHVVGGGGSITWWNSPRRISSIDPCISSSIAPSRNSPYGEQERHISSDVFLSLTSPSPQRHPRQGWWLKRLEMTSVHRCIWRIKHFISFFFSVFFQSKMHSLCTCSCIAVVSWRGFRLNHTKSYYIT